MTNYIPTPTISEMLKEEFMCKCQYKNVQF